MLAPARTERRLYGAAYNHAVANRRHPNPDSRTGDSSDDEGAPPGVAALRIDKWLWCARFFKTRSLAQAAVEGGHVQVNGERVKASRQVKIGDRLHVVRERERFEIDVLAMPTRRGPAAEARGHYRETAESAAAREHLRELNRLSGPVATGRPDKRERRDLMRVVKGRGPVSDDGDGD
jgi:ribosome-associated heat shock protein Hsp15